MGDICRKRIIFFGILSFVLCGCAVTPSILEKAKSNRKTDVDMEIQTSSPEPGSEISSLKKENCSKLEVANRDIDVKK